MDLVTLLLAAGMAGGQAAAIAAIAVPIAALLAAVLPHPAPGSAWAPLRNLLDLAAMNWGHASNAAPRSQPTVPPKPPLGGVLLLTLCLAPALMACDAAQRQVAMAIAPAATGCALGAALAMDAHASSDEPDPAKAAHAALAVVTDPACLALLAQLGAAAARPVP